MCSVLNTLSKYAFFWHIKKHYFVHFWCLFLNSPKAFSVSLKAREKFLSWELYLVNFGILKGDITKTDKKFPCLDEIRNSWKFPMEIIFSFFCIYHIRLLILNCKQNLVQETIVKAYWVVLIAFLLELCSNFRFCGQ